ncbi:MAG: anti-sigma factor [Pseudomonadota bacterium]|jgi:anti-sigma factor RsiW|nr:MAG: hypothetical protein DIU56_01950 [Pseudomonadota bacterium]
MMSHAARPHEPQEHVELDLPWYVNGTLPAHERERIERHLAACERCRESHASEVRLAAALGNAREPVECAPQSGWNRLAMRLDALESDTQATASASSAAPMRSEAPASTMAAHPQRASRRRVLPAVVLAQAAALAMLAFALLYVTLDDGAPRYRTLTSTDGAAVVAGPALRVVFDESASNAEIRSLLEHVGGSIVAGPTERRVYTVRLQRAGNGTVVDAEAAADWLRTKPQVLFVEPVDAPESR